MKTNNKEPSENKISFRVGGTQCPRPPPLKLAIRILYSINYIDNNISNGCNYSNLLSWEGRWLRPLNPPPGLLYPIPTDWRHIAKPEPLV